VNPRAGLSLAFGVVLALLTGVGYVLIAERVTQRITTPEAAEKRLDLPVLATISRKE
jgi:capsular polysaccharide biosynthesis protein